jgi:inorganic triphosphatase YgiF
VSTPSEPRECELKLRIDPADLAALAKAPVLHERAIGKAARRRLVGTYFDTPDRRLAARQLALRVRRVGRRRVQTLKSARDMGAIESARVEWEAEVRGERPDLGAFGDPRVLELTGLVLPDELAPVFTTEVTRRSLELSWPLADGAAARIEVALDRGEIEADGRKEPIAEVELELLEGEPAALFELAAALRRLAPLRLDGSDKAARGYRLATGALLAATRAPAVALELGQPVEQALACILRGCIAHALMNEATAIDGRDIEGVHQLRIALRRLRSALSLFRSAIADADRLRWQGELRWALGCLGHCRDLDVLLAELLPPLMALRPEDRALALLAEVAEGQRERERQVVRDSILSRRWGDLMLDLACWTECAGWRAGADPETRALQARPVEELAAVDLERGLERVLKRGRGFRRLDGKGRHALRIALKKLRYGIEFFADLFESKAVGRWQRATRKLQDRLGQMNDIITAEHHVDGILGAMAADDPRRLDVARGGGALVGWHAHLGAKLEKGAHELWRKLRALEPFWRAVG